MAEIAGLVLGGIPLIVWSLDNYRKGLSPAKDYWRYDSTLATIQSNIFIQQEQLHVTLRKIGLHDPSNGELERHLRNEYPEKHLQFMTIIGNMDVIVKKLMDKLDIDAKGKTNASPDRAAWEWRRVKRSFKGPEHKKMIEEMQYWNNALRNCFEKREIPSDESDPMAQELQARFDPQRCDIIREHARAVHGAIEAGWNCICQQNHATHRANLSLEWLPDASCLPGVFNLALSFRTPPNDPHAPTQEHWRKVRIKMEENDAQQPADASLTSSISNLNIADGNPPNSSKKLKMARLFGRSRRVQDSHSTTTSHQVSVALTSVAAVPCPSRISSLCRLIKNPCDRPVCLGFLPDPDSAQARRVSITSPPKTSTITVKTLPLQWLLPPAQVSSSLELSRKQRFGIAAAMAWAVLHLCGSPWLRETWDKNEIHLFLENNHVGHESLANTPSVSSVFDPRAASSQALPEPAPADVFRSKQIRNKYLFALGILLIELCINRPFEEIRKDFQRDNLSPNVPDDYEIANSQADKIYLDAGDSYGYAVQRCLRCEFPGRDVTKTFDFEQFRRHFHNGVVAPIQATFSTISAL